MGVAQAISLLLLLASAGACAPVARTSPDPDGGPLYTPAEIYEFDLHGLRLGMAREDACRRLLELGFRRHGPADCSPDADDEPSNPVEEAADGYLGPASRDRIERVQTSPALRLRYVFLLYRTRGGRETVVGLNADTDEPRQQDALERATVQQWGTPTRYERYGYTILRYGPTAAQVDGNNRSDFQGCQHFPECRHERGTDCARTLSRFASVIAEVVIYDWGRSIRIEDHRPYLRALRASGALERRDWERRECGIFPAH
jgi:hypothetical protein